MLEIVRGHVASNASKPLVVVGGSPYAADYTAAVEAAAADGRVRLLGGVWDQDVLDQLYANAFVYWHGHSVGGTNPSLLRAIGSGTATNAFDVSFNREVLGESGRFWSTPDDVRRLLEAGRGRPRRPSGSARWPPATRRAATTGTTWRRPTASCAHDSPTGACDARRGSRVAVARVRGAPDEPPRTPPRPRRRPSGRRSPGCAPTRSPTRALPPTRGSSTDRSDGSSPPPPTAGA